MVGATTFTLHAVNSAPVALNLLLELVTAAVIYRNIATRPSQPTAGVCFQTTGVPHQMMTTVPIALMALCCIR